MLSDKQEDLLIAITLAEFNYGTENVDPELADHA